MRLCLGVRQKARKLVLWMCGQKEREGEGKKREAVKRLQHYVWRAPSIKQVFEKGRQREKVSAKYLKEC